MSDDDPFAMPRPGDSVPFELLDQRHAWVRALRGVPQDPVFHAEGDVWIHTKMVAEALVALESWRTRPLAERHELYVASLLHDVAKPRCTQIERDVGGVRIRSLGHAPAGARVSRRILWELGIDLGKRERIAALVRFHQVPYRGIEGDGANTRLIRLSQTCRLRDLACLSEADVRGRICPDQDNLLENIELFHLAAQDLGCDDQPFAFASDHSRASFFRHEHRDPTYQAHDDNRLTATVMSGLPGAGKSHWVTEHLPDTPCVRLDDIRRELAIGADQPQGRVIAEAYDRARTLLRAGQDFVWDATNLSRDVRRRVTNLCMQYRARIRIVYVEAPPALLHRQNANRAHPVPPAVLERLLSRWDPPDPTECHELHYIVEGHPVPGPMRC